MERIIALLCRANGRRLTRTLSPKAVGRAVTLARQTRSYAYVTPQGVANSYGYRAYRTVAFAALRDDGRVAIAIAEADGNAKAAPRPREIAQDIPTVRRTPTVERRAREWANAATEEDWDGGGIAIVEPGLGEIMLAWEDWADLSK